MGERLAKLSGSGHHGEWPRTWAESGLYTHGSPELALSAYPLPIEFIFFLHEAHCSAWEGLGELVERKLLYALLCVEPWRTIQVFGSGISMTCRVLRTSLSLKYSSHHGLPYSPSS